MRGTKGYTEPDPRDDLVGDGCRTQARHSRARDGTDGGTRSRCEIESLVPESLRAGSIDDFLARLPEHDAHMTKLFEEAKARGEVLRYVGVIDPNGRCSVGLKSYPRTHAFAGTSGSDNIVAFTTKRYHTQSLIVQGPGAGPEVTAGGVFADLLRLASYLGRRLIRQASLLLLPRRISLAAVRTRASCGQINRACKAKR